LPSCYGLNFGRNSFQILCNGGIVVIGWRTGSRCNMYFINKLLSIKMEKYLQLFTLEKDQGNHHIVIIGSKTLEETILE
jgi:hypothetical protein